MEVFGNRARFGIRSNRPKRHRRNFFQNHGDVRGVRRRFPPAEWCVAGDEDRRHMKRIKLFKPSNDGLARVCFVIRPNFRGREQLC